MNNGSVSWAALWHPICTCTRICTIAHLHRTGDGRERGDHCSWLMMTHMFVRTI